MNLSIFALEVVAYFALHSLLAANGVKFLLQKNILPERWYRLVYNLLAVVLLLLLVWHFYSLEKEILLESDWLKWPGLALLLVGFFWMFRAMQGYDMGEFLGYAQMETGGKPEHNSLNTNGLNAKVRHPLYFGTLLVAWGIFLLTPTDAALVLAFISTLYLIVGSRLEERKLVRQFGEAYRTYQREVPMLLPIPRKHHRK